jgi:hypothetical protein
MNEFTVSHSSVYNFEMPNYIYVQITGVDKPARIRADKVEKQQETRGSIKLEKFTVIRDNAPVGEFKGDSVIGWWIEEEAD